jgi:hypothetical protein
LGGGGGADEKRKLQMKNASTRKIPRSHMTVRIATAGVAYFNTLFCNFPGMITAKAVNRRAKSFRQMHRDALKRTTV